ncbi:Non-repetitive/WGA-negative nucleoporin C-terminal-domain-containing protein [Xylariaceae sp. FL0804]|nr:Non-repetitive/WGA-negative nucleoporin C-terminal-domain-containing protein [Xylariaceae sp. FL0804]
MFTPSAGNSGGQNASPAVIASSRGRRRQRPLSAENSVQQPKAKRLRQERPAVTDQTFVDPTPALDAYEVKSARPSMAAVRQDGVEAPTAPRQELSVRSKKVRPGDRSSKGDGSTLQSTNTAFDVRKLPAFPERLKLDAKSRQHGSLDSSSGYALSLTPTHAIVWPYAASSTSSESFIFTLPSPSRNSTDLLPLGALVAPSASSSEPGLVVVMPSSGKITYWESISSATTLDFMRQQRNGVEDSIPGLYSGETATQIVTAESAASFVLALSTGRLAHLSVRDAHGRPKISVQFLRTSLGPPSGGIFGSLRNALAPTHHGDIVAIQSHRSSKQGECTLVAATSKGRLHSWRIHRGGHHDLLAEVDARSAILEAVQKSDKANAKLPSESLKILDFCFVPRGLPAKYQGMSRLCQIPASDNEQHVLVLTSLSENNKCRYTLVEVVVPGSGSPDDAIGIGLVQAVSAFSTPPGSPALSRPRLYLPRPSILAFLVFDRAAVVVSIAQPPDTPDSQIMEDNHILPASFEDVIDLRSDATLEIVGSGIEEPQGYGFAGDEMRHARTKTKNPAAVLLVRGAGTLRIAISDIERFASEDPPKLTAKAKLEQAVFFGVKEDCPLAFDIQHDVRFSDEDYTKAALKLSQEILTSSGPHLSSMAARLDDNIKDRARYLDKMIRHLRSIKVNLDRAAKWKLLWDAEKMKAADTLWQAHEEFLQLRPPDCPPDSPKSIVAEIVEYIRAEEKTEPNASRGETDPLRHWFIHDVDRMDVYVAWAYEVIKHNSKANLDSPSLTRLIFEATEVYNRTLREAFSFRSEHLELYGLQDEKLEHGILPADSCAGLDSPWTCQPFIANNIKRQVELSTEWVKQNQDDAQDPLIQKTWALLPRLTDVYLRVLQELARSYLASEDPKKQADGQKYQAYFERDRHEKVVLLAKTESWEAAIQLAESNRSLAALAEVLTREIDSLRDQLGDGVPAGRLARVESKMSEKEDKVRDCFAIYGEDFAFPFYEYLFSTYGVDALLEYDGDKTYKTAYLRRNPELAKISWINDITGEDDIDHAADTLLNIGLTREQYVWNKKIELSLGKLARLAESSRPSSKASMSVQELNVNGTAEDAQVTAIDRELAIIAIQDDLYNTQIRPIIRDSLDESADLALVQEAFPLKHPKKYKILSQIFEDGLKRLLQHEALDPLTLIDVLTLLNLPADTEEAITDQFFLAIQVAHNGLQGAERVQAERLIWRRCFLREDWTKLNNTSLKKDDDVMNVLAQTDLFQMFCTLYANQRDGSDKSEYRRLMPSEAAGVYTDTLDRRFESMEKGYREKVLEAMRWEDSTLCKHIEKHRLDQWAKETRKFAEEAVDEEFDKTTAVQSSLPSPSASAAAAVRNGAGHGRRASRTALALEAAAAAATTTTTNGQNGTH